MLWHSVAYNRDLKDFFPLRQKTSLEAVKEINLFENFLLDLK